MAEKNKIQLSISIMVSNRIDTVKKCMESIKPVLEQIPGELIIVDTVGEENSDGSLAIAKEYADKVVHFDWCNDFGAARNAGLRLASGEWFMFMDDDEWFDDAGELIEFFKSGEYKEYACASYKIHDYRNKTGKFVTGVLHRLTKLEKETRFIGTVHEYLFPRREPCKELTCYVNHYGYMFETEEDKKKHSERNLTLLRPEFEKNPKNMHLRLQMVQECMFLKELNPEALELCRETFRMDRKYAVIPDFQWIMVAYIKLAYRESDWEEVAARITELKKTVPVGPFANLAFHVMEITARHKLGQPEQVKELGEGFWEAYRYLEEHPKQRREQDCIDLSVYLDESVLTDTMKLIIRAFYNNGETQAVALWAKRSISVRKKPIVSVSLLVSNRKDTIRKCMESLKPLLDAVPSELIVVDTVGEENSDGSLAIAKEYASEVVHFDWCNDFAAARNAGLERAKGEWFVFLDDDEWFEDVSELAEFFKSGEYMNYSSATYRIRNYTDTEGTQYNETVSLRMIKKGKDTEFTGKVHETFSKIYQPCKALNAYVHHYGYVYANEEEKKKHTKRNAELLQAELEKNPFHMRFRAQMALELATYDNERAMEFCKETFALCEDKADTPEFQWQLSLVFRLYEALSVPAEQARATYAEYRKKYQLSESAEAAICFQMVRIHILCGEDAAAYPYAARYFEAAEYLRRHPEEQQKQMTADFYRYQNDAGYQEMLHYGAYAAMSAEAYETAWNWYKKMPWENASFVNVESYCMVQKLLQKNVDKESATDILERVLKNKGLLQVQGLERSAKELLAILQEESDYREKMAPQWIKSEVKLSIGILVSNNVGTVKKCLESLKPILEAVPSELIVVDTVGEENSDGSLAIAKEYATRLVHFDWCGDFAAARNCYVKEAKGEWLLSVDDDEWFEDTKEIVEFFRSGECDEYGGAIYFMRNYTNAWTYSATSMHRFFRRTPATAYVGKVHEQINEAFPPFKEFTADTYAHHTGYLHASAEDKKEHQDRNVSILEKELKEKGLSLHRCMQYVQELFYREETREEGLKLCNEYIQKFVAEGSIRDAQVQWMLVATARYYYLNGDIEGLHKQAELLQKTYHLSQLAKTFLSAIVLDTAWARRKYALVEQETLNYISAREWLQAHPEEVNRQDALDLQEYYTFDTWLEVLYIGAQCANEQKKYELANLYWKLFPWKGAAGKVPAQKLIQYKKEMERTLQGFKELLEK